MMKFSRITLENPVPRNGFQWAYKSQGGKWQLRSPPEDWQEADYLAFKPIDPRKGFVESPDLSDRYYLAVVDDFIADPDLMSKVRIDNPDLYLEFASTRPTPKNILALANRYGLLDYDNAYTVISKKDADSVIDGFRSGGWNHPRHREQQIPFLALFADSAADWLSICARASSHLEYWRELRREHDVSWAQEYLESVFTSQRYGQLKFAPEIDQDTGLVSAGLTATSLGKLVDLQWGMSLTINTDHRQCLECTDWFSIHPQGGRPEKVYCSDACRMRAHRKRKSEKPEGARKDGR